ncbi:MAG: hypothetical protein K2K39_03630 [Clostridia bacterium]|nr:hypothetical protein [Clostridia bacterium]
MNEEIYDSEPTVTTSRKILLEIKDLLIGVAFPMVAILVISTTILVYADYAREDLLISLFALIGGEIMLTAAFITFGRANGSSAYKKTLLHAQKRGLGSKDERVICKTGEYALWKAAVIALILSLPFIIFQTIELCYSNVFTSFCLKYMCGWAYFPFSYLGKQYQGLNFIMLLLPLGTHMLGYWLGKLKVIKNGNWEEEERSKKSGKRRRK